MSIDYLPFLHQTLSLRVQPGRITAIVCGRATELHAADALLAALAGAEETPSAVIRGVLNLRVFGEPVEHNSRAAYFSGREAQLPLQAGSLGASALRSAFPLRSTIDI
jgi:hypothetical protein